MADYIDSKAKILKELELEKLKSKSDEEMIQPTWENIDKQEIAKSVVILDLFTKIFCRYVGDYERFGDLKFRCKECPFEQDDGKCLAKQFKNKYAPDYRDFGSMGDL